MEYSPKLKLDELYFNQFVKLGCITGDIQGRLVQVRVGIGPFGSNLYLVRKSDGEICAAENVSLHEIDPIDSWPEDGFDDWDGAEYKTYDGIAEVGFMVENPTHPDPERVDSFTVLLVNKGR